jgi:hypothetical protein
MAFFIWVTPLKAQDYCKWNDCEPAIQFYKQQKAAWQPIASKYQCPVDWLYAIVAPEVAYFSVYQDRLETLAMEVFYVELGADYAQFSIGYFQMQPQFVEQLEQEIEKDSKKWKAFQHLLVYTGSSVVGIRKERLKRIRNPDKAFEYLCFLYCFLEDRYQNSFEAEQKLLVYANAYNTGFRKPKEEILKMAQLQQFPHCFRCKKFNYGKTSLEIYKQIQL